MFTGTIAGNIGKDAVIKETQGANRATYCLFSVAVKVPKGREKVTEWVDVTVWGAWGEAISQYATKGKAVTVTGELSHAPWTDKQSNPQAGTRMKATGLAFQGGGSGDGDRSEGRAGGNAGGKPAHDQDLDDEIPF